MTKTREELVKAIGLLQAAAAARVAAAAVAAKADWEAYEAARDALKAYDKENTNE
jgi:hypothetical protein